MVTPPPDRDLPDWAAKNHLSTSPVYYQNYVLGELMASQLISYIHKHIVKSDNFVGHQAVGAYLVDAVFKPGSRYVWSEMLQRGTAESLNPDYFIRQFV
jgi:peptidyl-dipeptidase A